MAKLFNSLTTLSQYRDRRFRGTQAEFEAALLQSCTVYVGNLTFFTTEEQIHEVFSKAGEIKRIVMGLDRNRKTPCGFCFVIYYTREDTEDCVRYINGTVMDDRPIRVDFDWGYEEGRQWGRGSSGGQVRDEYRVDYDEGRGGFGKLVQAELNNRHHMAAQGLAPMGPQFMTFLMPPPGMMAPPVAGNFNAPWGGFRGPPPPREANRKRGRGAVEAMAIDGGEAAEGGPGGGAPGDTDASAAPMPTDERPAEKNPRFRERHEDDDEEDGEPPEALS
eukprot:jgi/Mesvir1/7115/Mv09219-RA.1